MDILQTSGFHPTDFTDFIKATPQSEIRIQPFHCLLLTSFPPLVCSWGLHPPAMKTYWLHARVSSGALAMPVPRLFTWCPSCESSCEFLLRYWSEAVCSFDGQSIMIFRSMVPPCFLLERFYSDSPSNVDSCEQSTLPLVRFHSILKKKVVEATVKTRPLFADTGNIFLKAWGEFSFLCWWLSNLMTSWLKQ